MQYSSDCRKIKFSVGKVRGSQCFFTKKTSTDHASDPYELIILFFLWIFHVLILICISHSLNKQNFVLLKSKV